MLAATNGQENKVRGRFVNGQVTSNDEYDISHGGLSGTGPVGGPQQRAGTGPAQLSTDGIILEVKRACSLREPHSCGRDHYLGEVADGGPRGWAHTTGGAEG